jgi:hypothetical protein
LPRLFLRTSSKFGIRSRGMLTRRGGVCLCRPSPRTLGYLADEIESRQFRLASPPCQIYITLHFLRLSFIPRSRCCCPKSLRYCRRFLAACRHQLLIRTYRTALSATKLDMHNFDNKGNAILLRQPTCGENQNRFCLEFQKLDAYQEKNHCFKCYYVFP